jgi:ATP-dependent protease HslVU (ClpYQ) peptidase subunit
VQNVISRITHGMIGLDLQSQGKKNKFVDDLLSLQDEEIIAALKSASVSNSFSKFAPLEEEIVDKHGTEIIASVNKAKQMISECVTDKNKIALMIEELEEKLAILYSL